MDKLTKEDKKRLGELLDYEIPNGKSDVELLMCLSDRAIGYGVLLKQFRDVYENARDNFSEISDIFIKYRKL